MLKRLPFAALWFLCLPTVAATQTEWDRCIKETQARLFEEGGCGTSNCYDEENRSLATICRDKVGSPPLPDDEAQRLIEVLEQGGPAQYQIKQAQTYPDDSPVGRALADYWKRSKREIEAMQRRNNPIEDWRVSKEGGYIIIEGTTNRSGNLISAAVACDGDYVGNALGSIQGGGTFTMMVSNVAGSCSKVSLSRIAVE